MSDVEAWRFNTDSYQAADRAAAWRDAMHRLGLPVGDLPESGPPTASVTCLISSLGIEFALIDAGAQAISGRRTDLPAAIWLTVLLEGKASIQSEDSSTTMAMGDIAYGPTGRAATLLMETRCRILFVSIPRVALDHRLVGVRGLKIGRLEANNGVSGIFSGLLRSTANALHELSVDELRPVELALTEFLAASLAEVNKSEAPGVDTLSPHLHRICQIIETLLPDADLSLRRIVDKSGVSPRYIQKLFAAAGDTFGHYLRVRRLERCRMDLASPMCARLSISEICFRWGFNDSAHFSRAFRKQYATSPREYRRAAGHETRSATPRPTATDTRNHLEKERTIKRWMITGIASGLGAALARAALDRGDIVAGTARDAAALKSFEALAPGRAFGFRLDMRDDAQVAAVAKAAEERTGGIDLLVNNAGYGLVCGVEEATAAEVRDQFEINVFGQLAVLRAVLPFMRKRRAGHVVNVTSVSGLATWAGTGIYCASKFAFEAIGQTLAQELAELGIKVTNVAPGSMRTDYASRSLVLSKNRIADYNGRARQAQRILADHAGKESGDPARVAAAILKVVDSENPPLHLLLGADALHYAGDQLEAIQKEIEAWKPVTLSTAFPG